MKLLFFLILKQTFSISCDSRCLNDPCDLTCFTGNCENRFKNCLKWQNCPSHCWDTLSDTSCDWDCNIEECAWDGLDCKDFCGPGCDLKKYKNDGKCQEACFNELCDWDGEDCKVRKLKTCACEAVDQANPMIYTVAENGDYTSLTQIFNEGLCCKFVRVELKTDAELAEQEDLIVSTEGIEEVWVVGLGERKIVSFGKFLRVLVSGTRFVWQNVQIRYLARGNLAAGNFEVYGGGRLEIVNAALNGDLFYFADVKLGQVVLDEVEISGVLKGEELFSFRYCASDCEFRVRNSKFSGISSEKTEFLSSKNTEFVIDQLMVEDCEFNANIFSISRHNTSISNLSIINSSFQNFISCYYLESLSITSVLISDSFFQESFLLTKYSQNISISSIQIKSLTSFEPNPIFSLSGCEAIFDSVSITSSSSPSFFLESHSKSEFNQIQISNQQYPESSIIADFSDLTIKDSKFNDLIGSALYITRCKFYIKNTNFTNCSSFNGGGASLLDSCGNIIQSFFKENKAIGKGGALYINSQDCVRISESEFEENQSKSGGAIFSMQGFTDMDNVFKMNKAVQGNDKASSISKIVAEANFDSAHPGHNIDGVIKFTMIDIYDQFVILDSESWLALSLINAEANSSISGTQFNKSTDGIFIFSDLSFFGKPGSNLTLKAELFCDDIYCRSKPIVNLDIPLSFCYKGEVLTDSLNNCVECPEGYYSIDINSTQCKTCPSHAKCSSNKITPVKGYWSLSTSAENIYKCINPDSCKKGGECAKGYTGNLCAVCADGYISGTSNTCKKCPSPSNNIILISFLTLLFTSVICYIIYRTYEDAYEPKLYHSVLIKILMNYLQLMMLTSVIKVRWPDPFYDLISIQEQIGSNTGKLLSIDCLIQDNTSLDPYYVNQLFSFVAPLVLGVMITLIWLVISMFIVNKSRVVKPFITSLVVVFFILHPGISSNALSILSCYEIENGEFWNTNSFDIQCYTQEYASRYYALFVLDLALWTIGMPALGYVMLWKNRTSLDDPSTKAKYGFLYHGYQSDRFYWEFVIMLRKLLIISVAILMRYSTVSLQLIFVLILLLAALALNQYYKPFELSELNRTENYSIILSIICLTSGLMIESGASRPLHIFLFIVLVVSNLLFFFYFGKRVYQAIGHYLWSTCPHIARNICPNAQRPKIKIREILQKEERKNRNKKIEFEPQSGFVDGNKEVIIQLWNMRHFADFYNEVLAARFSSGDIEEVEKKEQEMVDNENNQAALDLAATISESRPFFRRIFTRKKKNQTVQQKIMNIRRQTLIGCPKRRVSSDGAMAEAEE